MVPGLVSCRKKPDIAGLRQQEDVSGLIRALQYPDVLVQKDAATALSTLGPDAASHLIAALTSRDIVTKLGVIEALGKIKDTRCVEPLISCLRDESNEVRWAAAIALGESGDLRAAPPLVQALKDADKYVRYGAAVALTRIGWKPADAGERALYFFGLEEWNALAGIGPAAITALSHAARDRDTGVRLKALDTLGELHCPEAEPFILRALSDENSEVRWKAVLVSQKSGISPARLPRWLAIRPRNKKSPLIAGFLNFMLPGLGYGYLGKWWGVMIFQIDITLTVWLFKYGGETNSYSILFPLYILLGIHAAYMAADMPEAS